MNKISTPKRKRYASPYSAWETIKWLWKNVRLRKKNPGNIHFLPKKTCLNEITLKYSLTFIGDIMDLGHKFLEISSNLKNFIHDSDFLIGNFEATITDAKPKGMDQIHDEKVIVALEQFFIPSKTYLCVANNHSGDFGKIIFENSVQTLINAGFNVFGKAESPTIDITPDLRIITGTMWSNRQCNYIAKLEDIKTKHANGGSMNIFYPHWGYDLELYPRLPIIQKANKLLLQFDAIVGHHTHAPQPIASVSIIDGGPTKLCAYSLGDFCFGKLLTKHFYNYNYGLILKTEVGTTNKGQWAIGNIEWSFIECMQKNSETMLVEMKDSNPYFLEVR